MPRTKIIYDAYKVKAFLDTNIILEGRPLAELPWEELDADGPIIALITPTAMKEIDSKKQDGRSGKRAREFNRLIAPAATGGPPIMIRESSPRVDLALSYAVRIPWDKHDDLNREDGDSCIVAEALYAKNMSSDGKLLLSHDIKPIAQAVQYDFGTFHVSEKWLRPMEPGPAEKEVQRLKSKLAEYEAKEPAFEMAIELLDGEPVPVTRIEDLTEAERNVIERRIEAQNPEKDQLRNSYGGMSAAGDYDYSYRSRYNTYRKKIPVFMKDYAQRMERVFNQVRFRVVVTNTGKVHAENLLIEVSVLSGWLHDRYVWVSPSGPTPPSPRPHHFLENLRPLMQPLTPPRVGRHDFAFKDRLNWRSFFAVTCEDFRHGENWVKEGIVGFDPRDGETIITVIITASNLRGKIEQRKTIERRLERVHVSRLIDLDTLKIIAPTPLDGLGSTEDRCKAIDWNAFEVEEE